VYESSCMGTLKKKSISNKINNTHFFGISVFEGEESNNRYKKYLIQGIKALICFEEENKNEFY